MSALALSYEADVADSVTLMRVTQEKQALLHKQNLYPLNRREARDIGKEMAKEAELQQHDDEKLVAMCEAMGIEPPESKYGRHCVIARLTEAQWWGRKIRVADWRAFEAQQLRLGNVRHFVSNDIERARTWHREALANLLENMLAIRDDDGAVMSLADLASRSTSNPANRRAEMIVRAKGLARWRAAQGYTWTFVTITAPSKFHRMTTVESKHGKVLVPNDKWDGSTPRDTQEYLCKVWNRIRAKFQRMGLDWSAFRTVEPHADATPHWHLCVFLPKAALRNAKRVIRDHALKEDRTEKGAWLRRCTFKDYKAQSGRMEDMADQCVAYLIAYVSKNIDGMKTVKGPAQEGGAAFDVSNGKRVELGPMVESARRVEAWATTWGIRQFQELGGSRAVTAYRELRRLRDPVADNDIEPARAAADASDYRAFISAARGVQLKLWAEDTEDRLQVAADAAGIEMAPTLELADLAIENNLLNKWGEPSRRWIMGVQVKRAVILPCVALVAHYEAVTLETREHTWQVVDSVEIERRALAACVSNYHNMIGPIVVGRHVNGKQVSKYEAADLMQQALAVAPGFFFSRAAPPRASDLCQ